MKTLFLIGIGSGNPDHLTRAAIHAINTADIILIPRKGGEKSELAELRRSICAKVLTNPATRIVAFDMPTRRTPADDYLDTVDDWHTEIARSWQRSIADVDEPKSHVALLVWGDPSLYDSTMRIARRLNPVPRIEVVPGITALQALCAAHAIPLNELGEPFIVTTGRRLRDEGWPSGANAVAIMLDGTMAFQDIDPNGVDIWWGAYLGMKGEALIAGPLVDVAAKIKATRQQLRAARGWIMDIYLLKRRKTP